MKKVTTKTQQEYLIHLSSSLRSYYWDTIDGTETPIQLSQQATVKIILDVIAEIKQKNEDVTALL